MKERQLLTILEQFGFLPQQARLYLAGLLMGTSLMQPLAKKAGIKRTTAIYAMRELLRRKFFKIVRIGKRMGYQAVSPEELLKITRERERLIKKFASMLN